MKNNSFRYLGFWWIANNKNDRYPGIVSFTEKDGVLLELLGQFKTIQNKVNSNTGFIINGIIESGKEICILNCRVFSFQDNFNGFKSSKYKSSHLLIGINSDDILNIKFDSVSFSIDNLPYWVGKKPIDIDYNFDSNSISVNSKEINSISFSINSEAKASIHTYATHPFPFSQDYGIEISTVSKLYVTSTVGELNFDVFINILNFLEKFFSFSLYERVSSYNINFFNSEKDENLENGSIISFEVSYFNQFHFDKSNVIDNDRDVLMKHDDISEIFQSVWDSWYSLYKKEGNLIDLYLNNISKTNIFDTNDFLNMAQILEAHHRNNYKNEVRDKSEHQAFIKNLLKVHDKEEYAWLKEKLAFTNEPSFAQRFSELLNDQNNEIIKKIIVSPSDFVKKVKDTRNYYTHYSDSLELKIPKQSEIFFLYHKLRIIFASCILSSIGLNQNKIGKILNNRTLLGKKHFIYI